MRCTRVKVQNPSLQWLILNGDGELFHKDAVVISCSETRHQFGPRDECMIAAQYKERAQTRDQREVSRKLLVQKEVLEVSWENEGASRM